MKNLTIVSNQKNTTAYRFKVTLHGRLLTSFVLEKPARKFATAYNKLNTGMFNGAIVEPI